MALAPGTRLAHYEIEGLLGAGGMGEVYAARDTRLEREVAIKVLPPERVEDGDARRRLIREARLAAQLNHPHICTIHDVGDEGGVAYIAMERVRGRALDQLIRPEGLAPGTVVAHGAQIADALEYAHEHGIVHRDLKSSNVLVTSGGQVKVLDFGLARQLEAVSEDQPTRTATRPGVLVGTPHYLAPEILRGGAADVGSDLWSLGVVLYEMACGVPPFRGATLMDLGAAILNADPEPLPARVPHSLAAVIERCLAKDPAQRYRSAGEVRAALEAIGSGAPVTTGLPARRRVGGYAIAVVAILLVAAALVLDAGGIRSRLFGAAPAGRVASLAVLPLANLSHQPDQQYFADGITDELITRLAQTGGARVTSRTSVMALQGSALPLPQIARRLGVDAIVEGSVERSGDRVRISAQLIRAATDEHLWAQSYERDLRDVLALQDEVAGAIANAVEGRLEPAAHSGTTAPAVSRHGYELYLRALDTYRHWDRYSDRAAMALLEQAIREDSSYAPPWAAMGLVYLDGPGQFGTREDDVSRARGSVVRALALDPRLGLAYAVKAQIELEQDWDWRAAETDFKRAIEAAPSLFEAHHGYAHLLMNVGREPESMEQSRTALALDPLNPAAVLHMGYCELARGEPRLAVERFQAGLRLDPGSTEAYRFLAEGYALSGRWDEAAAAEAEAFRRGDPADTASSALPLRSRLAMTAVIAARRGHTADALHLLSGMIDGANRGTVLASDVASIYALLGRKDEAFRWLDRAFGGHETPLIALKTNLYMASLRSDPRFAVLLRRIGLPA